MPIDRLAAFSNGSPVFPPFPAPLPPAAPGAGAEVDSKLDIRRRRNRDESGAVTELVRRAEVFRTVIGPTTESGASTTESGRVGSGIGGER